MIVVYNLQNPSQPFKNLQSPLKWQTRCIACFPDGKGFAIGSIEGRVGIQYVEDKDQRYVCPAASSQIMNYLGFIPFLSLCGGVCESHCLFNSMNFSFKCHRGTNNDVYAVNWMSFHPIHGTFSTAGSDGT